MAPKPRRHTHPLGERVPPIRSEHPQNENKRVIGVVPDRHMFVHGAKATKYDKLHDIKVRHDVLHAHQHEVMTFSKLNLFFICHEEHRQFTKYFQNSNIKALIKALFREVK